MLQKTVKRHAPLKAVVIFRLASNKKQSRIIPAHDRQPQRHSSGDEVPHARSNENIMEATLLDSSSFGFQIHSTNLGRFRAEISLVQHKTQQSS